MKGKALSSGDRKIIINVFNYFKTENPSLVEMRFKATGASATSEKNCRSGRREQITWQK